MLGARVEEADELPPMAIVGDFVIPPIDGAATRDFQTLHFDFGLPLDPKIAQDVARFTALHVLADVAGVHAATRLVPLVALLGQRSGSRNAVDPTTSSWVRSIVANARRWPAAPSSMSDPTRARNSASPFGTGVQPKESRFSAAAAASPAM